ncbi:hypothetical protein CP02DC22_0732A, partial [Chlamydia psittaci 02DC22]
MVTFLLS